MKKIYLLLIVIIVLVLGLAFMEYFRLNKMFQIEKNLTKAQASILLDELLTVELKRSAMDSPILSDEDFS